MAKRGGRRKDGRNVRGPAGVSDPTVMQMALDYTVEQKAEAFDEAGNLWARIETLKAEAASINKARRAEEKKLTELHRQASAGKRTVEVEYTEQVDMDTRTVRFIDKRDGKTEIGHRAMTSAEVESGVVLNPGQAQAALAAIAAEAGEQPSEGGNGHAPAGDFTFNEDDPAPGSPHPADVAQVAEAVGHEASA